MEGRAKKRASYSDFLLKFTIFLIKANLRDIQLKGANLDS